MVFAVHLVLALVSYIQVPALWRLPDTPRVRAFFDDLGSQAFEVTTDPATWLAASHWFESVEQILLSYFIPFAIASIAAVMTILLMLRSGEEADARTAQLLLRWSIAFAAACLSPSRCSPRISGCRRRGAGWSRRASIRTTHCYTETI